ncbi:MAG: HAMP domain-containing protein [Planctomycetes bacterium]|nr:HAMP domain-containing protein [Planctomycetota bacterium]
MRIRFRTKILLSLLLTVAALLGGALIALDRAYVRKVEGMVGERYAQGRRNFDLSTGRVREALEWGCDAISESSRFKSVLEAGDSPDHVEQAALFEMEYRGVWAQFLVVADVDGKSIVRCRAPRGASREEAKRPTERHAAAAGGTPPEAALVQRALAVAEELQAGAEGLEKATAELREFLLDDGRIYLVVARPVDDEGHLRGVVVLGAEMSEEVANRLHETLVGEDAAAFVAEQHFKGASFPPALRVEAEAAVQDRLAGVGPGEEADLECVIGGKAYRAVLSPIQRRGAAVPIYAALFVCLETFVEFRREMRELTVGTGAVAVVLCIFLSVAVARGVSAPVLDLVAGTGRVANGEYSARIRIHSRDELGDLAESFNRMAEDLASKEKVRAVLNKVVSRDVAETLLKTEDLGLGGRLVDATLLFADLRGFTALTQGMAP